MNDRAHPQFPTRQEVEQNPELAYSDHLMILAAVPLGESKKPLNIISLNVLGNISCSGIHPSNVAQENKKQNYDDRYERIAKGLKKGIDTNNVDVVFLQEADDDVLQALKTQLGSDDWEYIADNRTGIISCYKKNRLMCQNTFLNSTERVRSISFQDLKNDNMSIDVHNIWGKFSHFPEHMEDVCRNALINEKSTSTVSVILGDTNSRIAPIDDQKRNLTTGIMPAQVNYLYSKTDEHQITDYPDGGFYRNGNSIHQLTTKTLDFVNGSVVSDNQSENVSKDYRMLMCLDESYKTNKVVDNKNIFEYEQISQTMLNAPDIIVRMASDSFNNKALAIKLPKNSPLFQFIKTLSTKDLFVFEPKSLFDKPEPFACAFIPLDKVNSLSKLIAPPLCDEIVKKLKTLTQSCLAEVGRFRDAYKILKKLNDILDNDKTYSETKANEFYNYLSQKTNRKSNFNIIQDDKSKATGRFIAGVCAISAIIITGIIPGLVVMGIIYAFTKTLPHHLLRPHEKGKEFTTAIDKVKPYSSFFAEKAQSVISNDDIIVRKNKN